MRGAEAVTVLEGLGAVVDLTASDRATMERR